MVAEGSRAHRPAIAMMGLCTLAENGVKPARRRCRLSALLRAQVRLTACPVPVLIGRAASVDRPHGTPISRTGARVEPAKWHQLLTGSYAATSPHDLGIALRGKEK